MLGGVISIIAYSHSVCVGFYTPYNAFHLFSYPVQSNSLPAIAYPIAIWKVFEWDIILLVPGYVHEHQSRIDLAVMLYILMAALIDSCSESAPEQEVNRVQLHLVPALLPLPGSTSSAHGISYIDFDCVCAPSPN